MKNNDYTKLEMSDFKQYDTVIFHKGCPDGSASAWVYWRELKSRGLLESVKFVPMEAGKYPVDLDVKGKRVIMMDVCPKRNEIDTIAAEVESLTILDHHKSGEREVEGLDYKNVHVVFDMNRSGCQIAWDYFNQSPRPWFLDIIGDRDLWKWEVPNSKELGCYMFNLGFYYDWEKMSTLLDFTDEQKAMAIKVGETLLIVEDKQVEAAVRQSIRTIVVVDGKEYKVRFTGCSHTIASEVGARLSKLDGCDFAAMWRYNPEGDEWWISCRASKDEIDLSVITKKLGGGGHAKAAGFTIKNEKGVIQSFFRKVE